VTRISLLSRRLAVLTTVVASLSAFVSAESLTGTVINKTNNKPAVGDDVVLIRLAQGMQESTRTKTDSKGRFTLELPDAGVHLVRVTHDKANYFRPAPPGTQSVEVEVFDAATKVAGVSSEADVMRIQSDESGKTLKVVENFFVKNESNPPKTQFGDRPFEFYLPEGAVVEGSAALGPGGMPVQAAPAPLGDPNHYAFIFPIRPGETRFQITYHLPYSGSIQLGPKPSMTTDTVAIMMPKSMTFKAGASSPYSPVTEEMTAQTYVARNVSPSQSLEFTVSGTGQLPRDTTQAAGGAQGAPDAGQEQAAGAAAGSAATDTRPGGGLGNPIDPEGTNDPWAKYKWWILGGLGLAMAAGAGIMLKNGAPTAAVATGQLPSFAPVAGSGGVLASLKDELFSVETDRLEGRLNEAEYAEQKAAIEVVLKRALARKDHDSPGTPGPVA
jgi:5-hydroxyisourate hydrolase-like protein (transthyretin family)